MKYNDFDWGQAATIGTDLLKTITTTKATTTAATAATTAANTNLQAQQIAQQNLQNQLLLASKQTQPATTSNKTLLWVAIGVGAAVLITVFVVVLAKRR